MTVKEKRRISPVVRDEALVAERHECIFRAASRVFIRSGYHQATVREIALEAGLSLGTLYTYVRTKEDILYLVFDRLTTALRESIGDAITGLDDPVQQIRAALEADLKLTEQYQNEILLVYQEAKSLGKPSLHAMLTREAEYVAFFEQILQTGYDRGVFTSDPRLSADIITYLCSVVALRRWNLKRRFQQPEVNDGIVEFILRGLGLDASNRSIASRPSAGPPPPPDVERPE